MKVAVVNNWVPFVSSGAEHLASALVNKLAEYGHQSMLVRLPFAWQPPGKALEHMLACRSIRLSNIDRVIALKFPAYYVPHTDKVLWLLHQFRQAYDLWGTAYDDFPGNTEGRAVRDAILCADNTFLPECRAIYANSPVTAGRLKKYNGLDAAVLYPPLADSTLFRCEGYGDYVFYPSRITGGKRQHLVVEAMRHVRTPVRLVVAGDPETPPDLERLETLIRRYDLAGRVRLMPGFLPEREKAEFFSRALACVYAPYDEDSYGYVTLEACHSRKATLTLSDSGGVHILVKDGETGYVRPPEPTAIAEALDRLYEDREHARRMGEAAYARMMSLNIAWDHVIRTLTS